MSLCLALVGASGCSSSGGGGAAAAGAGGRGGRGGRGGGGGAQPAVLGFAEQKDVPVDIGTIGNVEAFSTISARPQVSGVVTSVGFEEGAFVKPGDVLFKIDPRPYQAALEQAQANLTRDQALLVQAEAQLKRDVANSEYTRAQADRQAQLVQRGIISRDALDQATAAASAGGAVVDADKAAIESAKAQLAAQQAMVDSAKLQLDYTTIKSPIAGRTGNLNVKAGNLVNANSTEMTTITQVDPIYVSFSMPARNLPNVKEQMAHAPLEVTVSPQGADGEPETGRLTFVDNAVDPSTDTIRLKATLPNTDHSLWPGEFVHVSVRVSTLKDAVVVPSQAVQTGQDGQFIFVVNRQTMAVEQRPVTTGQTVDDQTVITKGIAAREQVVVEGQVRLEAGTIVTPADAKTGEATAGGRGGRGRGQGGQGAGGQGAGAQGGGQGRRGGGQGGADQGGQVAPGGQGQTPAPAGDGTGVRRGGGSGTGGNAPAGASDASGQGGQRGQGRGGRRGGNGQGRRGQGSDGQSGGPQAPQ